MFREKYKKDFDSIKLDLTLIENTAQKFNNNPAKRSSGIHKCFIAAVAVICLFIVGGFMTTNLTKPVFALVAFAGDSNGHCVSISENTQVMLPFGKISRGAQDFYLDKTGKKIYTYAVGFDTGGISVKGKNISSVKYISETGEFRFLHFTPEQQENSSEGKEIVATFSEELGSKSFDVNWIPWEAINLVSEDGTVDYANLPSDNVTIEVAFKNGKTMTKHLRLSFNNEGNLIAKVVTE